MSRAIEAAEILAALGLPKGQQNERSAFTLLALASIGPSTPWKNAKAPLLRTVDIMSRITEHRGTPYKPNTRETIRRQTLHQFEQARIVDRNPDNPIRPTNSGKSAYRLTRDALRAIHAYGRSGFASAASAFVSKHGSRAASYRKERESHLVPLKLTNGETVHLSPGKHNVLQVAVVEQFGPRFAPSAEILYIGDTAQKHVVIAADKLKTLKVPITRHDKLPDVLLYWPAKNWLFLIEAVTSHGPISPKRHAELESVLVACTAERVYVTAFLDTSDFKKHAGNIAWETEVWIADKPDHMVHFDGLKFFGPYKPRE